MTFHDVSKSLKKLGLPLVFLLLPALLHAQTLAGASETEVVGSGHQADDNQTGNNQTHKEIIPPPPPGPYMSSALSDYSVKGPSFGRSFNKPVYRHNPSYTPMDMFSPDIPWPNNLRGNNTSRWSPENGYRYAPPQAMVRTMPPRAQQPSRQQHRPANTGRNYSNGYLPNNYNAPTMNMNGSRWMPAMGNASAGPYYNGPSYRENSSNNYIARPAQPPYRAQNPRYNQSGSN